MRQFLRESDHVYLDAIGSIGATLLSMEVEIEFERRKDERFRLSWRDSSWVMARAAEAFIGPGFDGVNGLRNPLGEDGFITDLIFRATFSGAVSRGELFGRASIRAGGLTHGIPLAQGYIYTMKQALRLGEFESSTIGRGLPVTNEGATTLVNNTAVTRTIACPTRARWLWKGGTYTNGDNVTRNVTVRATDGTNEIIRAKNTEPCETLIRHVYPSGSDSVAVERFLSVGDMAFDLREAFDIEITWAAGGVSGGGTARSTALVEEWIEI